MSKRIWLSAYIAFSKRGIDQETGKVLRGTQLGPGLNQMSFNIGKENPLSLSDLATDLVLSAFNTDSTFTSKTPEKLLEELKKTILNLNESVASLEEEVQKGAR